MARLFGTDGIRGEANAWPMTPDVAFAVGGALAGVLPAGATVVIGGDTRRSRGMIEGALTAGLAAAGVNVKLGGILPTPAVAAVTRGVNAHAGVAITASHNPASDNGIKIFNAEGCKLDDALEEKIAWRVLNPATREKGVSWKELGSVSRMDETGDGDVYEKFVLSTVRPGLLHGMTVVLDCANGAASFIAPDIFRGLGARVETLGCQPDGMNINDGCGALHPQKLLARVRETNAGFGVALDGDADRLVMCDAGGVADGDMLIAAAACALDEGGRLAERTVVVTSMSNLGLHAALARRGIRVETTDVGDRHVIARMRAGGFNFGGENSGHVIFGGHLATGDGILAALQTVSLMRGAPLSAWLAGSGMALFPQRLESIRVREKIPFENLPLLRETIRGAEADLGADGRVVARYSGTENKIRLLVEARSETRAARWAAALRAAVEKELCPPLDAPP